MHTPPLEFDAGTGDEVYDGPGDKSLARAGQSRHSGPDVDRDASNFVPDELDFASVQSGTGLDAQPLDALTDLHCTADGAGRAVEAGHESVTCGVDLFAPESMELAADDAVMLDQQIAPPPVT